MNLVVVGSYQSESCIDVWVRESVPGQRGRRCQVYRRVTWSWTNGWACSCGAADCEHVAVVREHTRLGQSLQRSRS